MSVGWNGFDPVEVSEGPSQTYELGTQYTANAAITITQIRLWAGNNSRTIANHKGYIWSAAGAQIGVAVLPDKLLSGWTTHNLSSPVDIAPGAHFAVSYGVQEYYAARAGGYPVPSADALVTAAGGAFHDPIGNYPDNASNSFYGADIVYSAAGGSNTAPVLGLSVSTSGLVATAVVTVVDESPSSVLLSIDWGDGTISNVTGPGSYSHTYAAAGNYAVLVLGIDAFGLYDAVAAVAQPISLVPPSDNLAELNVLRYNTLAFIRANPIVVQLIPRAIRLTGTGAQPYDLPPRLAQTMRLIDTNAVGGLSSGLSPTSDGSQEKQAFQLLLPYNGVVAVNDYFVLGGLRHEVIELLPYNGYELRASVVRYG